MAEFQIPQDNDMILNEQKQEKLTADVAPLESRYNKDQSEIEQLEYRVQEVQQNRSEELLQKVAQLERVIKKMQIENTNLLAEVGDIQSVSEEHSRENRNLKTAVQKLEYQVEEAKQLIWNKDQCIWIKDELIWNKDELIAKQNRLIAHKQQVLEELYIQTNDMKQSICDLKDQLERRWEDEMLAGIENLRGECSILVENAGQLDSAPASEAPTSMWCHCAKGLLKVGLYVGITIVGILIPVGVMATAHLLT